MALIGISGKIGAGKDTVGKIINYHATGGISTYTGLEGFLEYYEDAFREGGPGYPFQNKKFASMLKLFASMLTGIPTSSFEDQDFKNMPLGPEWNLPYDPSQDENLQALDFGIGNGIGVPEKVMTVRELLQKLGTDAMRNGLHPNVWVNALFAHYTPTIIRSEVPIRAAGYLDTHQYPNWMITDARFPNEAEAIKKHGGFLIRVDRPCTICGGVGYHKMSCRQPVLTQHASETALDNYTFDYTIINDGSLEDLSSKVWDVLKAEKII